MNEPIMYIHNKALQSMQNFPDDSYKYKPKRKNECSFIFFIDKDYDRYKSFFFSVIDFNWII